MVEWMIPYSVCGVFGCAPCKPCADKGERDGTANQMKLANGHGGLTVAAVRLAESASGSVTGSICSSVAGFACGSVCGWLAYGATQSLFSGAARRVETIVFAMIIPRFTTDCTAFPPSGTKGTGCKGTNDRRSESLREEDCSLRKPARSQDLFPFSAGCALG